MLRLVLGLALLAHCCAASADAAIRPNSLIFNETVPLIDGEFAQLPLYFTRRGDYYVEAILERKDGKERPRAVGFDLTVSIARRDEALFERRLATELGRSRPAATLFWLTTDREVPLKTPLIIAVRVESADPAAADEVLRLQVRRKLNRPLRRL
ncbi:MAG: hypothetical protein ACU85V_05085 [Gammaproteobacteria bacterium]